MPGDLTKIVVTRWQEVIGRNGETRSLTYECCSLSRSEERGQDLNRSTQIHGEDGWFDRIDDLRGDSSHSEAQQFFLCRVLLSVS